MNLKEKLISACAKQAFGKVFPMDVEKAAKGKKAKIAAILAAIAAAATAASQFLGG